MKNVSKADLARRAGYIEQLAAALAVVEDEHRVLQEAMDAYNAKVAAYNAVLAEAMGFAEDIASEIDSYMGERSDKWHESDAAEEYGEWRDAWQSWAPEEIEDGEMPAMPEPTHGEDFEALPERPGEA